MATIKVIQRNSNLVHRCLWRLVQTSPVVSKTLQAKPINQRVECRYSNTSTVRHDSGVIKSKYADVQIPTNVSLPEYLMSDFDKYGDQVALVDGLSDKHYTFRQLKELVRSCGSGLVRHGFKPGDVCLLYKPNSPEYFVSINSVSSIGGVVVTANPLCTVDELVYFLKSSDASWLITAPGFVEKAVEAVTRVNNIKGIFVIGDETIDGCISFTKLMKDDGSAFPSDVRVNPTDDVAALLYSSGTTGLPKGVMLTHYNFIASLQQLKAPGFLKLNSDEDVLPAVLPFFHIAGLLAPLFLGLKQGVKLITAPKFDPETFLRIVQEYKASRLYLVPPILVFLAKHPLVDHYDISNVSEIGCGAAPAGPATIKAVRKRLGRKNLPVRQVYGLTECCLVTCLTTHEKFEIGSVGTLTPNTEGKVVDVETGEILGVGQDGELCFRGPQVMKGYLNNIEATQKTITHDGWLHTGDIGHYDEKGHFYVVDRLKELIKYKAFQVAPAELENLILSMQGVRDVAVIGLPDDEAGELPKAFIVPASDNIKPEDVIKFVEGKVAPQKRLRGGVEFIEEIPKSASGKILRRVLKALELERLRTGTV
ncbi:uncharacterized protein [Ptychodera flava]|uniref:uncharacterized protein n=1 Tax=Ptychodera flava TaxID=63121 RepID=UPI00396A6696